MIKFSICLILDKDKIKVWSEIIWENWVKYHILQKIKFYKKIGRNFI